MVPAHPARHPRVSRSKLAALVNQILHDLSELHDYAHQLRSPSGDFAQADFSPRELDSLTSVVRQGHRALTQCQEQWRHASAEFPPDLNRAGNGIAPEVATPSRLIVSYKRCSRHVGLALQEAREVRALAVGDVLYRLLRDLEKQLWLLKSPRERSMPGFTLVRLFQGC